MIEMPPELERLLRAEAAKGGVAILRGTPVELRCSSAEYPDATFSAIYMPDTTLAVLNEKLDDQNRRQYAVNINGTALYRPLTQFTADMLRVVGKSAFDL